MDNDPKRLTSEDIKLLLQPPPNTKTCNDVAFLMEASNWGNAIDVVASFVKQSHTFRWICSLPVMSEGHLYGSHCFKKIRRTCCNCGSLNEGDRGLTKIGKVQQEMDCFCTSNTFT